MNTDEQQNEVITVDAPNTADEQLSEEEFRWLYIEQQRRLSCPGCGEDFEIF